MILLFDVGNSNIEMGIANEELISSYRFETYPIKTGDEYYIMFKTLLNDVKFSGVIIASVVPKITGELKKMVKKHFNIEPLIMGVGVKTGLIIKTANLKEVGADLVADSVGAFIKYESPTLVVDLGTATKFLYVKNKSLLGVIIAPGVVTSLKALSDNTALLPHVEISAPKNVLGNNTVECMQSGVTYGVAAQVDGLIKRIRKEVNEDFNIIATGGLASTIIPLCDEKFIIDESLIMDALIYIYNKNI